MEVIVKDDAYCDKENVEMVGRKGSPRVKDSAVSVAVETDVFVKTVLPNAILTAKVKREGEVLVSAETILVATDFVSAKENCEDD